MQRFNKATVAAVALALVAGLEVARDSLPIPEPVRPYLALAIVVLGTAATYLVPNKSAAPLDTSSTKS